MKTTNILLALILATQLIVLSLVFAYFPHIAKIQGDTGAVRYWLEYIAEKK